MEDTAEFNPVEFDKNMSELPEIPASLRRAPAAVEVVPDVPIEIERQYVSVEEEGGNPIKED